MNKIILYVVIIFLIYCLLKKRLENFDSEENKEFKCRVCDNLKDNMWACQHCREGKKEPDIIYTTKTSVPLTEDELTAKELANEIYKGIFET